MGSKQAKKIICWVIGLKTSFVLYQDTATDYEMQKWQENYMWPVIIHQIAKELKNVNEESEKQEIRKMLVDLEKLNVFKNPTGKKADKYMELIYDFIGK